MTEEPKKPSDLVEVLSEHPLDKMFAKPLYFSRAPTMPPSGRSFADMVVALGDTWIVASIRGDPEMTLLLHVDGLWCMLVSEEVRAMTAEFAGKLQAALQAAALAGETGAFRGSPLPKRHGRDL